MLPFRRCNNDKCALIPHQFLILATPRDNERCPLTEQEVPGEKSQPPVKATSEKKKSYTENTVVVEHVGEQKFGTDTKQNSQTHGRVLLQRLFVSFVTQHMQKTRKKHVQNYTQR